jgi:hypothetical protein
MTAYLPLTVGILAAALLGGAVLLVLTGVALHRADKRTADPDDAAQQIAALTADLQRQARINERLADRLLTYQQWAARHLDCPHHYTTHPRGGDR